MSRAAADRRRTTTRARIVAAAAGLIAAGGRDAATTRAVAAAARVQAPTIYRLFGDKRGLLDAVAEYEMAAYIAAKARRAPHPDPGAGPARRLGHCTSRSAWRTPGCSRS
jgi:AcrR family transcriptional regulator